MAIWKWFYYMPNTLKEMYESQVARAKNNDKLESVVQPYDSGAEPTTMALILGKLFKVCADARATPPSGPCVAPTRFEREKTVSSPPDAKPGPFRLRVGGIHMLHCPIHL